MQVKKIERIVGKGQNTFLENLDHQKPALGSEDMTKLSDLFGDMSKEHSPTVQVFPYINPNPMIKSQSVDQQVHRKLRNERSDFTIEKSAKLSSIILTKQLYFEYKKVLEYKLNKIKEIEKSRDLRENTEKKIQDSLYEETIQFSAANLPQVAEMKDPYFMLIGAYHSDPLQLLNLNPLLTIEEAKYWLKFHYRISYDIDLIYDGNLIEVGAKFGTLDIKSDTTLKQVLDILGYSTPEQILVVPSKGKFNVDRVSEILEKYAGVDEQLREKIRTFTTTFWKSIRQNPNNFLKIFDRKEIVYFIKEIDIIIDTIVNEFNPSDFKAFEKTLIELWLKSAQKLEPSKKLSEEENQQIIEQATKYSKYVRKIYENSIALFQRGSSNKHPNDVIKLALLKGIVQSLCDSPNLDGKIPYTVEINEIFDRLKENLEFFKKTKYFISREFLTLSMLLCLTSTTSFDPRKFGIERKFDSGGELEVFSLINIVPKQHLWFEKNGYKLVKFEETKFHDADVEKSIKKIKFGPGQYIAPKDSANFDVNRWLYRDEYGNWFIVYLPNKNSMNFYKYVVDGIVENTFRAVYESNNEILQAKSLEPSKTTTEVLLIGPFLSQDERYNSLTSFGENFLFLLSKGVDLGKGCWQERRPRSSDLKLSIADGHKYEMIKQINEILGYKQHSDLKTIVEYKNEFNNKFSNSNDKFIKSLFQQSKKYKSRIKFEEYWGIKYNNEGKKQFGAILEASIRMYLDKGVKARVSDFEKLGISTQNIKKSDDGKYIEESTILGFKMDNNGNPSYRLFNLDQLSQGLPMESEWQIGYPKLRFLNKITGKKTFDIIPQVIITHRNGNYLLGRYNDFTIHHESKIIQLKDNGEKWFMDQNVLDKNILEDFRGVKYGLKTIFYELDRYGNTYTILGHEIDLTSMKFKFGIKMEYYKDRFKHESFKKRKNSQVNLHETPSFLRHYPIAENIKSEIMKLKDSILTPIFKLAQIQIEHNPKTKITTRTSSILPLEDKILRFLNSFIDENGVFQNGLGYDELRYLFKYLVKDKAEILCYNRFYLKKQDNEHLIFNIHQSDKEWFKSMLSIIINFEPLENIQNPAIKALNERILEYKLRFANRYLSDGPNLNEYEYGTIKFEDESLVKELKDAVIDIFGRYTYIKMVTGALYFDGKDIQFITLAWNNLRENAFKHNNRLFLQHYKSTKGGVPPGGATHGGSFGYILDTIIFGITWRLQVIREYGGKTEDLFLDCPHVPTDAWNPAYITEKEVLNIFGRSKIIEYTDELSNWLLKQSGRRPRFTSKIKLSKSDSNRMLHEYLLNKFKAKVNDFTNDKSKRDIYLYLIEQDLYHLFSLYKSGERDADVQQIKKFLSGTIKKFNLNLKGPTIYMPPELRTIELNQGDYNYFIENNLDKVFLNNLHIRPGSRAGYKTLDRIMNLEDSITNFGKMIKDLALRFGNPSGGNHKKLYIIPTKIYDDGLGQHDYSKNKYIDTASDRISIDGKIWKCWILDGSENGKYLKNFNKKYVHVIRGFLEGQLTLFIFAIDEQSGEYIPVCALNAIQGALNPNQVHFSSHKRVKTFPKIDSFDQVLYDQNKNENIYVLTDSFKKSYYNLITLSDIKDYNQFSFIREYYY